MPHSILSKKWQYNISRNVPLWHDSLYFVSNGEYKKYKLPPIAHFRVHRGELSDFYMLARGQHSQEEFIQALQKNLDKPAYINFLKQIYQKNCALLIEKSISVSKDIISLKDFFNFYGRAECMLDITATASKFLTTKAIKLLNNFPRGDEIMAYYSRPKYLPPLQKLKKEINSLPLDIDINQVAGQLWSKYRWIPVSFVGEPWSRGFFVKEIKNREKERIAKIIKPTAKIPTETERILYLLSEVAYLNEYRKAAFSQVSLNIRPVLDRLSKAHGLSDWKDTIYLTHDEIFDLIDGNDEYQKKIIARRKKSAYAVYNKTVDSYGIVGMATVKKFEKKFKPKSDDSVEVVGMTANKGKIIGPAKIISGPQDFHKFKTGDILIAKMTSVDFLPIMKKAGAFVTDEGGLACHAAIVAREYGKPCLIGTGLATAIFKDGDEVEVDAEKGIVRKI